jgi:hypothetical protein
MSNKRYLFDPQDLKELLVHYSDGAVPLNGVVTNVGASALLQRVIMLEIESDEWEDADPVHIRYDHYSRLATWKSGQGQMEFEQKNDNPKIQ